MIRFDHKAGRWSDEKPRHCDWLTGPGVIGQGAAVVGGPPVMTLAGQGALSGTATTLPITLTANIPVGSQIYLAIMGSGLSNPVASIADSRSNTGWVVSVSRAHASFSITTSLCSLPQVTIGLFTGDTITVTYTTSCNNRAGLVAFATNMLTSSGVDQVASNTATSTNPSTTTPTTTQAHEEVVTAHFVNSVTAITQDTNYTALGSQANTGNTSKIWMQYREVTSTGAQTYAPTNPSSVAWITCMGTYKCA